MPRTYPESAHRFEGSDGSAWYTLATENFVFNQTYLLQPADAASTVELDATYSNGTSGVGATLTANANGVLTLDGVSPAVGKRVVIKNQDTDPEENGFYVVTDAGSVSTPWILTRSTDADANFKLSKGLAVRVMGGTTQSKTTWIQTSDVATMGTSDVVIERETSGILDIDGTANEITVAITSGNATISITDNPVIPGHEGIVIPSGSTAQRPSSPAAGTIRFNTDS